MLTILKNHRSVRKYADRDISDELLKEILEAGTRASNTGNMQIYCIVATRDQEVKKRLAPAHFNQPMITSAPVVLTFCADVNRFTKWCEARHADVGFMNFESFMTASVDAIVAAQNVCIAAEAKGLGICYLGTTTYNAPQIVEALNLPEGVMPVTTVTLGFPAEEPPRTERLPLKAVVHADVYHDFMPEDIDSIYAEQEQMAQNQRFVEENNKENLAQVFAEVRYTKAANEHFSQVLIDTLKKQKLM